MRHRDGRHRCRWKMASLQGCSRCYWALLAVMRRSCRFRCSCLAAAVAAAWADWARLNYNSTAEGARSPGKRHSGVGGLPAWRPGWLAGEICGAAR